MIRVLLFLPLLLFSGCDYYSQVKNAQQAIEEHDSEVYGLAEQIRDICADNMENGADSALLDSIDFIAYKIQECDNDAMSILDDLKSDIIAGIEN